MQLTDWLLANSKQLSLKADKYSWVDEWLPGFFDYGAIIKVNNKTFSGRGIDKNEELAFHKAAAEALERAAVGVARLDVPWSTAAYPTAAGAEERAYYELLGIDRIFCHHYCGRKMREIPREEFAGFFPDTHLTGVLKKNNLDVRLYELRASMDARSVCAIATGGTPSRIEGFVAGFGTDKTVKLAVQHALIECLRTAVVCLFTDYKPEEPLEVLKRRGEPRWHFWQAQTTASLRYLRENLLPEPGKPKIMEPENISISDVSFNRILSLNSAFPDIPLVFTQAFSSKLIAPQFGDFTFNTATMERLRNFNGGPVSIDNAIPHFYG